MSDYSSVKYKDIPVIEEQEDGYWECYADERIWHPNNMKFNDYKQSEEKYGISGGDEWMAIEEGDNKIRIVSEFIDYGEHFDNIKKRSFICLGKDECEYCKAGEKPRVRYLGWVIDRRDEKIKLLRFGHSIFKQIGALAVNEEYQFDDLPGYDMTIKREGKGLDTEYSVTPSRNDSELTEKEGEDIIEKVSDPHEIIENMKTKLEKQLSGLGEDEKEEIITSDED